jgi:hypothetical protein
MHLFQVLQTAYTATPKVSLILHLPDNYCHYKRDNEYMNSSQVPITFIISSQGIANFEKQIVVLPQLTRVSFISI